MYKSLDSRLRLPCFCFFSRPLIYGFWRNEHDQYTNPLARPLLISLQVVRTSFGFHLRECMGSSSPPPPAASLQLARTHTRLTHCARASRATRLYTHFARRFARNNYRLCYERNYRKKKFPWEYRVGVKILAAKETFRRKQRVIILRSFVFWQIVMMWVVTWFKLVFKQGMFIMPKLCPPSSNSPQFIITDFWVACLDWQSINWENCSDVRKGEWIIRIQANASSKSIIFKFQT